MKHFLLIALWLSIHQASAGERGNGGDVILCPNPDGTIRSAQLYDHYEGQLVDGRQIDLGPRNLPVMKKVELVLKRIERLDKKRAALYRKWAEGFESEANFLHGIDLIDVPDTGDGYIPAGCELKQLVVQKNEASRIRTRKRYTVNADYWEKMDNDGKAGTILHEVILREFINLNPPHLNSVNARYFNSAFSDARADQMTWPEYVSLVWKVQAQHFSSAAGITFKLYNSEKEVFIEEKKGLGYWVPFAMDGATDFSIKLDGEKAEVSSAYSYPQYSLIFKNGVSAHVNLKKPHKAFVVQDDWQIRYQGTILLKEEETNKFSTLGQVTYGHKGVFQLWHPALLPGGCDVTVPTKVKYPYDITENDGRRIYYLQTHVPERFSTLAGKKCFIYDTIVGTQFGKLKVKGLEFSETGREAFVGGWDEVKTPAQSFIINRAKLLLGREYFTFAEITLGHTSKEYQQGRDVNGRTLKLYPNSVITVDRQGLINSCKTVKSESCPIL